MKRLATNAVAGWASAVLVGYWVVSILIPGLWLAVGVRAGLLAGGILALWVWAPSAINIVRSQSGPEAKRGEVLSLMGVATIAGGVTWLSVWGLLWYWHDTPASWTATGHSMFGQYLIAVGLALVYTSTDVKRSVMHPVNWWVVGLLLLAAGVTGFLVGAKATAAEASFTPWLFAQCHPSQKVWVSSAGVAHSSSSPYRQMIRPRRCFTSEAEASALGFRVVN